MFCIVGKTDNCILSDSSDMSQVKEHIVVKFTHLALKVTLRCGGKMKEIV